MSPELPDPRRGVDRREFVKLLGAGIAAAGAQACVEVPAGHLVPYVEQPPEITPGVPVRYATAFVLDGFATGVLAQCREGRPVKLEGNPLHPASLGASGAFEQASLWHLYDPDRGRAVRAPDGEIAAFGAAVEAVERRAAGTGGEGVHLLLEPTSSPLRATLLDRLRERWPRVGVHFHAPAPDGAVRAGTALFGRPVLPLCRFGEADVVVSFGSDFMASGPFHLRYAREFARGRRIDGPGGEMNRLYQAEPHPTPTGAVADHVLPARGAELPWLLVELLRELGGGDGLPGGAGPSEALPAWPGEGPSEPALAWVRHAAADLRANRGRSLVVAGDTLPPAAHALAWRANEALGNVGRTVVPATSPILEAGTASHGLEPLVAAMEAGAVEALVVLGGNPAYDAPAELGFPRLLEGLDHGLYLGEYPNETAARCGWYVPGAHWLEAWGDARALDGAVSIRQPVIRPLWGGRSVDTLLRHLAGLADGSEREMLRDGYSEEAWERALRRGVVEERAAAGAEAAGSAGTDAEAVPRGGGTRKPDALPGLLSRLEPAAPPGRIEVGFRLDPRVHDGRFANNAWLQELPDPVTKLTWDNAALMSPEQAERLGVREGEWVAVTVGERTVPFPALPVAGHADGALTLSLGYGRTGGERTGAGVGVDAYPLRPVAGAWHATGHAAARAGERHVLARTQLHFEDREERHQILHRTLEAYRADPQFTAPWKGSVESWYEPPEVRPERNQWGMTIDLSACTGCGACVQACQVENNIPVVGKHEVAKGRAMHWIRIDRYVSGPPSRPEVLTQPMPCQHCEKAPCEYVCPVSATVHSADGLNEMVYNRCVGTRFCSNNCPYKVRRFNWFDYNERRSPEETLVLNPDVTVRERGVMEKCTYCVQRIRRQQIRAKAEGRAIADGDVVTACQQACPTRVITFGDLADGDSAVAKTRESPRIYDVLHELGTEPRTKYLAMIRNPNPELHAVEAAARALLEHDGEPEGEPGR